MLPNILFFARDYQSDLFIKLNSSKYNSLFFTLTLGEKNKLIKKGYNVVGCFEEEFDSLQYSDLPNDYLISSYTTDRFFCKYLLSDRKLILSKEKAFFERIFDENNISAVINETVAIEIAEVMYIEASKRDIPYYAWLISPFDLKEFYWLSFPFNSSLDSSVFSNEPNSISLLESEKYIKLYKDNFRKPYYVSNLPNRFNPSSVLVGLLKIVLKEIGLSSNSRTSNRFLKSYYIDSDPIKNIINLYFSSIFYRYNNVDSISSENEIVLYPMHFEPEASILYFSEFNEDQVSLIRNLSKCLGTHQILVVKEHPQQPGMLLTSKYRKLRANTSNIVYVPAEYPSKKVIDKSNIIVTQTSTVGWESLMLGKKVVVLGKVFYDKHPDIYVFKGFDNLKRDLRNGNIQCAKYVNSIKFVAQFYEYCQEGNPFVTDYLYTKANINKIVSSIENKLYSDLVDKKESNNEE